MTRVTLYGLTVESEIPLPAPTASGPVDVSIRCGSVPETLAGARVHGPGFASHEEATLLRIRGVGRFLVRYTGEITVDPEPRAEPSWILHPLLAAVMGVFLQSRGVLTLHASAVSIDGRAAVFAGRGRSGKSTLAAYMARHGYLVQSDGFVAIVDVATTPTALPGPGVQKLWPDAVDCLGLPDAETHPPLTPTTTKRLVTGQYQIATHPAPIAHILVLGTGATSTAPRSRGRQRVLDLTDHLFLPEIVYGQAGRQSTQLLALAQNVAVGRLARAAGSLDQSLETMSRDVLRCLNADQCVESAHVKTSRLPNAGDS